MFFHFGIGLTVLALTVLALVWKLAHPRPPHDPGLAAWERALSRIVHTAFWILLIALPLTGWLYLSADDEVSAVPFFGLFDVSLLPVPPIDDVDDAAEDIHKTLGKGMAVLAFLHIAAALKHHFVDRDGTLAAMLPLVRRR